MHKLTVMWLVVHLDSKELTRRLSKLPADTFELMVGQHINSCTNYTSQHKRLRGTDDERPQHGEDGALPYLTALP